MHRINNPNHARYLTFSTYQRINLLNTNSIRDAFAEQLRTARDRHAILLYAWVIMPNHAHLLLREPKSGNIEPFLRTLKTGFAKCTLATWRATNAPILDQLIDSRNQTRFWQRGGGYDRNIISNDEFDEKTVYIHMNPVRANLVRQPSDWAWSSARWWSAHRERQIPCDHR